MIHDTQSAKILHKENGCNIYVIMKTMCSSGYQYNGFMASHALGEIMHGYAMLVPMNKRFLNKQERSNFTKARWA